MRLHSLTAQFLTAASSTAFLITDEGVRCRSGSTTSHAIQRQFTKGTDVTITCQTEGTNIEGNTLWDKTTFGCFVSDYYVATGSSGYLTSKCRSCRPPKSNAATANLIAGFEGFRPDEFEVCITAMLNSKAKLNRNQYGALISRAFNMGCGNAESSALVRRLNNGEDPNTVISQELPQWEYASGQRLPGLVRRRHAEIELAQKPTRRRALPKRC
ncbi:hypothetical protein J7337_013822 [Fusarium musae]|uniref:Lysozyme n=1 Tax=Fusarium musae TaxID=1042133 RepID=A0A9P8D576_9HYPO|nr:hypothetical protein J7337_013822 [Fusarium musae]KAG9495572.1 hypothetical protein J7337_013822 [Fusarium musae]